MSAVIHAHFLQLPFVVDTGGVDADTLCSSCSVSLSTGCGVLDVEAAKPVGAQCTGRLMSWSILSSFVITTVIRVLDLSIAVAGIIVDL
jgi:hypothetical protein